MEIWERACFRMGKLKIHKGKNDIFFLSIIFLVLLALQYHCFYIVKYSSMATRILTENVLQDIIALLSFILFIYILVRKQNYISRFSRFLYKYLVLYLGSWALLFVYSVFHYDLQNMVETAIISDYWLFIFLTFSILYFFSRTNGIDEFFSLIGMVTTFWYMLIILQAIIYFFTKQIIFDFSSVVYDKYGMVFERNGLIRISMKALGNLMIIYNFSMFLSQGLNKRNRRLYFVRFFMGLIAMLFVQQTRMYLFSNLAGLFTVYFLNFMGKSGKCRVSRQGLFILFGLLISVFVAVYSGAAIKLFLSFSVSGQEGMNTSVRLYSFKYFFSCFLQNPLFGNGFARADIYPQIENGDLGYAFYSDTGFIGLLGHFGIFSIVLYVIPLLRMISCCFVILKERKQEKYNFMVGLTVWNILCSFTLITVEQQSFIVFPIILAVTEYTSHMIKRDMVKCI